jgi:DNA (cytosine-5)-methyltransferase 1
MKTMPLPVKTKAPKLRQARHHATQSDSHGFRFVDLFAGIGGFHLALKDLGGACVLASEIDADAVETYRDNFPDAPVQGDITEIDAQAIPDFDFLTAGFPCQPFSKGGHRQGFSDTRGTLFFDIARILEAKAPPYVLLENVPNLVTHDDGRTFATIIKTLHSLGYATTEHPLILSPHQFGVPVHRPRVYIPAIKKSLIKTHFLHVSLPFKNLSTDIYSILDHSVDDARYALSEYETRVLDMWDAFYQGIDIKVIGFPVWADEFGADYPLDSLPPWKQSFIKKNRDLYARNKSHIKKWQKQFDNLDWVKPTHRKFEWQAGSEYQSVYECLIQFRPSGVRVRRPDKFSTLVAMNHAQIVGRYRRRLTPHETKLLQSLPKKFKLHKQSHTALKQLGNAVNVVVVRAVASALLAAALHAKS